MRKSAHFGYGITRSCCNISFPGGARTSCQSGRVTDATSGNGMQQHKSKIHWRLYGKSPQFSYARRGSWGNIPFPGGALTRCRPRRLVEATSRNGMQQHKSKIHWRLYEKKCPIQLWQNKVLEQHFIPSKSPNKVSALTTTWSHLRKWNVTTQVQNPSRIIWEKVPNSAMAEWDRGATFHSLEVPQQGVGPSG
jgi:hypothetical protein